MAHTGRGRPVPAATLRPLLRSVSENPLIVYQVLGLIVERKLKYSSTHARGSKGGELADLRLGARPVARHEQDRLLTALAELADG
jgi:hypothetical protein